MSPLLFIIPTNSLRNLFTLVANKGSIKDVFISEIGEQVTHGQFADNTNIMVKEKKEMVEATFGIFHLMDKASNLFVKTSRVKVVLIADGAIPREL